MLTGSVLASLSLPLTPPALLPLGPHLPTRGSEPRFLAGAVEDLTCSRTRPGSPTFSRDTPASGRSKEGGVGGGLRLWRPASTFPCSVGSLLYFPYGLTSEKPGGDSVSVILRMDTVRKQGPDPIGLLGVPEASIPAPIPPTQHPLTRKEPHRSVLCDPCLSLFVSEPDQPVQH